MASRIERRNIRRKTEGIRGLVSIIACIGARDVTESKLKNDSSDNSIKVLRAVSIHQAVSFAFLSFILKS